MSTSKAEGQDRVCVVTVTYGDRGHLVAQAVEAVRRQTAPVHRIVVVANGSGDTEAAVAGSGPPAELVSLDRNLGSAAGFKRGLERAYQSHCDLIWLLDDDNRPRPDALAHLVAARARLGSKTDCFASLRLDRDKQVAAATGSRTLEVPRNSFFKFEVGRVAKGLVRGMASRGPQGAPPIESVMRIEYGLYGGLLLPRSWIERIGYPEEAYCSYLDDVDFTTRIVRAGGNIYLVSASVIDDLHRTWETPDDRATPLLANVQADPTRYYYIVRNRVFLERRYFVSQPWRYYLNMVLCLGYFFVLGLVRGTSVSRLVGRYQLAFAAIAAGRRGRMGCLE